MLAEGGRASSMGLAECRIAIKAEMRRIGGGVGGRLNRRQFLTLPRLGDGKDQTGNEFSSNIQWDLVSNGDRD